ncbi:DUF805 domain-containing protein [Robertkochia solimangrovi]|uniref:DUF805 domain-containing protein n=1 Tax=Robertkochia solimangrovi TaxID=2213046 RepID=UPI00117DF7C8|nr:DUF805 domain-containing protein [Robertkochia solimangrovi]TRZ43567.1 hypothetical protein DMZ48_09090 [Robertkochia solimangrovi]
MFLAPFSFDGRIRRLEFGLSLIIAIAADSIIFAFENTLDQIPALFYLMGAIVTWFMIAQGTKRCHDLGESGFNQFIPFYILVQLFSEGSGLENRYGTNPKAIDPYTNNTEVLTFQKLFCLTQHNVSRLILMSTPLLSSVLVVVLIAHIFAYSIPLVLAVLFLTPLVFYFLYLWISFSGYAIPDSFKRFRERMLFSTFYWILCTMYFKQFGGLPFEIFPLDLIYILVISILCYPFESTYVLISKKQPVSYEN